jgi:hypothetical protein
MSRSCVAFPSPKFACLLHRVHFGYDGNILTVQFVSSVLVPSELQAALQTHTLHEH